eukprot:6488207-Amphidinium_carterae.1
MCGLSSIKGPKVLRTHWETPGHCAGHRPSSATARGALRGVAGIAKAISFGDPGTRKGRAKLRSSSEVHPLLVQVGEAQIGGHCGVRELAAWGGNDSPERELLATPMCRQMQTVRAQELYTPLWERLQRELGGPGLEQLRLLRNGGWPAHPNAMAPQIQSASADSMPRAQSASADQTLPAQSASADTAPPQPQSVPSSAHFVTDESDEDDIPSWAQMVEEDEDEDEIPVWAQAAGIAFASRQDASTAASSSQAASAATLHAHVGRDTRNTAAPRTPVVTQAASAATSSLGATQTAGAATLTPRVEVKEDVERRSRSASAARGALPKDWQELSRPRKRGRIRPYASHVRADFPFLLDEWLFQRNLSGVLTRNHAQEQLEQQSHYKGQEQGLRRWLIYDYNRRQEPIDPTWVQTFHGTWWYSLWSILESGVMLESNDAKLGHDFWMPGTYVTPTLETATWYSRPHIVFNDGVYQRAVIELRVNKKRIKAERIRGGDQWVFPADAVKIVGFRFKTNAPPKAPEQRFDTWDPRLEAIPDHHDVPGEVDRHVIAMSPIPP